ncbi:unnamed protein product, partial [Ostreobium quekettii]
MCGIRRNPEEKFANSVGGTQVLAPSSLRRDRENEDSEKNGMRHCKSHTDSSTATPHLSLSPSLPPESHRKKRDTIIKRDSQTSITVLNSKSTHIGPLVRGIWHRLRENSTLAYDAIIDRPEDLLQLEIVGEIGKGHFGTVYQGIWNGLEVAVKMITEDKADKNLFRQALEVAVMSTVSHPSLLQVHTFFTDVVTIATGNEDTTVLRLLPGENIENPQGLGGSR